MQIDAALDFARDQRIGVLATLKRDGRPQLSHITYWVEPTGTIAVSVTADRAKTRNVGRDNRVSLHVPNANMGQYAVIEGEAELTPVAAAPDDSTADQLVDYYRALSGEHPDWDDYRRAMVADGRQVMRIRPTHAYGMVMG